MNALDRCSLDPFPEGWYFIASRRSILNAKLIQKTWLGREIVAWCDQENRVRVAEAVCPHLGAALGPSAGGQIRDGRLVCPFHGFEYDTTGACVATPFAPPPKTARLRVFETRRILDLVFGWWGIGGCPPKWELPSVPLLSDEWSHLELWTIRIASHPQETTENVVDLAHLRYVHGYSNVSRVGSLAVDGRRLESRFNFKGTVSVAGIMNISADVAAVAQVFGLGYSLVEYSERSIGVDRRLWVLATPVDGKLVDIVLVGQLRRLRRPRRFSARTQSGERIVGLGFLPAGIRTWLMNKIIMLMEKRCVMEDAAIWNRKHYLPIPRLSRSDGEIGKYRRYCRQFYSKQLESSGSG